MAVLEQKNLIGSFLPKIRINRIVLEKRQSPLYVTLHMSAKEKFDYANFRGTWSKSDQTLSRLKIKVIQSLNSKLTEDIINGNVDIWQDFSVVDDDFAEQRILDLSDFTKFGTWDERTDNYLKTVDAEGNEIYDIPYTAIFENETVSLIEGTNPEHLAYFTICYIENTQDVINSVPFLRGELTSEIVFHTSRLIARGLTYYTTENKLWTGNTSLLSSGTRTSQGGLLTTKPVANSKVQDLRIVEEVESAEAIDLSPVEVLANSPISSPYFSDFYVSRDRNGAARFLFTMDCMKVYEENARFGKLFQNSAVAGNLMSKMKINFIEVYRTRVDEAGTNITGFTGIVGENETPTLVFSSADGKTRQLAADSYKNSFSEKNISIESMAQTYGVSTTDKYRTFTGVDLDMIDINDGQYQYDVEVQIFDGTTSFLQERLLQLLAALDELTYYYNEMSLEGNYNALSDRMEQSFSRTNYTENLALLQNAVNLYVEGYSYFTQINNSKMQQIIGTIINMCHPKTGTPDGVNVFITSYEKLTARIQEYVGSSSFNASSQEIPDSGTSQSEAFQNTFVISKTFDDPTEIFDASILNDIGIDYIENSEIKTSNTKSLITVSSGDLSAQSNFNKSAGVLELSYGSVGQSTIDLSTGIDLVAYDDFEIAAAYRKEITNSPETDSSLISTGLPAERVATLTNFFAQKGVTIVSEQNGFQPREQDFALSTDFLGEETNFETEVRGASNKSQTKLDIYPNTEAEMITANSVFSQVFSFSVMGVENATKGDNIAANEEYKNTISSTSTAKDRVTSNTRQDVEVLVGYGSSIKDPIWQPATSTTLDSLTGANLARLTPKNSNSRSYELEVPAYNDVILITGANAQASPNSTTVTQSQPIKIGDRTVDPEYIDTAAFMAPATSTSANTSRSNGAFNPVMRKNQYTTGGQYSLPDGRDYVGYYHIHVDGTVMTGANMITGQAHSVLTPMVPTADTTITVGGSTRVTAPGRTPATRTATTTATAMTRTTGRAAY